MSCVESGEGDGRTESEKIFVIRKEFVALFFPCQLVKVHFYVFRNEKQRARCLYRRERIPHKRITILENAAFFEICIRGLK